MVPRASIATIAVRATLVLAVLASLVLWQANNGSNGTPRSSAATGPALGGASNACAATVLGTLGHVVMHVYNDGVGFTQDTATAQHFIVSSLALREAVEHDDAPATRRAAEEVIGTDQLSNLIVIRGGRVLADVGSPDALTPVHGTLIGVRGTPIASYVMSVWSDGRFLAQTEPVTEAVISLRAGGESMGGSFALPPGELPAEGTVTQNGVEYEYTSFPGDRFPSGRLRIYVLMPVASTARFCGPSNQDTLVNTLSRVAALIYANETGPPAQIQVRRVQRNAALLAAVARRDPLATRRAIVGLLNQHVVRLRVSAGGQLLGDVGGPYVLGPVSAPLLLDGSTIGSLVLSIQDDEGYKRLAGRLAGLDVLMYMGTRLVKNSLGPNPRGVPASGSYRYRGRTFRVFTFNATAFPSGPLRITALIPIPYS